MVHALIGKKTYQGQAFLEDGRRIPLTHVVVKGNLVSQMKSLDKEGYNGVQLAFGTKRTIKSAQEGHAKKAGLEGKPRFFKEIRVEELPDLKLGAEVLASDVFQPGDIVNVTGVSKGKGYAGVVKRHHFKGGPRTHGQSDRERAPGSIGQTTTPGRVYKGKRMAGRMGVENVTIKNLEIIDVTNDGVLLIKGLVPGFVNGVVVVKKIGENKKFVPLYKEPTDEEVVETEAAVVEPETSVEEPAETKEEVKAGEQPTETVEEEKVEEATKEEVATEEVAAEVKAEEKVEEVTDEAKEEEVKTEETKEEVKEEEVK